MKTLGNIRKKVSAVVQRPNAVLDYTLSIYNNEILHKRIKYYAY
ncbi:hypothetical protein [Aquimarina acroporae]|nr:hypothetical protein [Aquimarina acroporae]